MDNVVGNPGLEFISVKIFSFLDSTDLVQCKKVSKSWNNCIDRNRNFWVKKLKKFRLFHAVIIHGSKSVLKTIFLHFEERENPCKVLKLLETTERHSKILHTSELYKKTGIMKENFIWKSIPRAIIEPLNLIIDNYGYGTMLHFTFAYGEVDEIKNLLDILKANELDVNPLGKKGESPLAFIAGSTFQNKRKIEFLCENIEKYGIDFNSKFRHFGSVFEFYCKEGHVSFVELILKNDLKRSVKVPEITDYLKEQLNGPLLNPYREKCREKATMAIGLLEKYSELYQ